MNWQLCILFIWYVATLQNSIFTMSIAREQMLVFRLLRSILGFLPCRDGKFFARL